jgi:drug/metabolite transporter (DMT)-like permease
MATSRLNTTLLAILACLLWSSAFAGVKIGLQYTSPIQFAGIRFVIAGLLVFPLAYRMNPHYFRIIRQNLKMILFLALIQTFLHNILFYKGISLIPGAVGAIVIGSQPLFVAVVAHFLVPGDGMKRVKTLVILLGIAGVVLASLGKDPATASGHIAVAGILLLVGLNLLSGFSNVFVASNRVKIPPLVISSASMIVGGTALFLLSLPLEGFRPGPKPGQYYLSLGWLSMLSAMAISIWITLLKRKETKVSDLNLWKFLIPLFGAILSWALLPGESPEVLAVTGMVIITCALIILNRINRINHLNNQEKE